MGVNHLSLRGPLGHWQTGQILTYVVYSAMGLRQRGVDNAS